jgi:hypothetical protein
MKRILLITPLSFLIHFTSFGQKTWSEHIAPIVYKNCTNCYHTSGAAPFSLMTYKEVETFSASIHHAVSNQSFNIGKNESVIPINTLPSGAYMVTIRSKNIYGVQSFIKI